MSKWKSKRDQRVASVFILAESQDWVRRFECRLLDGVIWSVSAECRGMITKCPVCIGVSGISACLVVSSGL
jgi:hypothetical protein